MREGLDRALDELREMLVDMSERADRMLDEAITALVERDRLRAEHVVLSDPAVDQRYVEVQHAVLSTVALQAPVGRDLRLLTAFLHVGLHVERMADHAVSIARAVIRSLDMERDEELVAQLAEMSQKAREVCRTAIRALVAVDAALARTVGSADDGVDSLELGIFERLVTQASGDVRRLPWAAQMIGLSRRIERYADHGVDIAEQVVFAATGVMIELSSNDLV